MLEIDPFSKGLYENADFRESGKYFDGAVQLNFADAVCWIKIFMGRPILVTREPPPFGYTFAIKGSTDGWRFALEGPKNRFREALMKGLLYVEGNQIEFARIGKAVNGIIEVLMEMLKDGTLKLEGAS